MSLWPFMLKSTHENVRMENGTLRDALREANAELRKCRATIVMMREPVKSGAPKV